MSAPLARAVRRAPLLALALATAGCPDRDITQVPLDQSNEQVDDIVLTERRVLDLLFVIDNSRSMREEQDLLTANFPRFMDRLEAIEGGLPDVHIGVVSSDVGAGGNMACGGDGDGGRLQTRGCAGLDSGQPYLADAPDEAGGRVRNYDGELDAAFACMAALGTEGCGFEQHLEAMRRALSVDQAGFLRDDAWLGVVVIADEDDCSSSNPEALFAGRSDVDDPELGFLDSFRCWEFGVECAPDRPRDIPADGTIVTRADCVPRDDSPYVARVDDYVDFLRGLKGDPTKVIVAGIVGEPEPVRLERSIAQDDDQVKPHLLPSCRAPNDAAGAAPPTRLAAFLGGFGGDRAIRDSICQDDLTGALEQIADLLASEIDPDMCVVGELTDVDPATAGLQPDCRLTEWVRFGEPDADDAAIPPCATSDRAAPCYELVPDPGCAGDDHPTGLALEIDRAGAEPPPDARLQLRCLVE